MSGPRRSSVDSLTSTVPNLCRAQRALDRIPSGVDVVISRNDVNAERRVECTENLGVCADVLGAIVDEIARDGDEIGLERLRGAHDAPEKASRRVWADVQVGELNDAQAVEAFRQVRQPEFNLSRDEPP